jgi:hypothetical protein
VGRTRTQGTAVLRPCRGGSVESARFHGLREAPSGLASPVATFLAPAGGKNAKLHQRVKPSGSGEECQNNSARIVNQKACVPVYMMSPDRDAHA